MIDFETDLRDRLDRATADVSAPSDLLGAIERRIKVRARRTAALRIAGAIAVVTLAAGVALVATGDDGDDGTAPVASDPTTTTASSTTTTAPLASGWSPMADAPIGPRSQFAAVDIGGEVFVWGGYSDRAHTDGAIYRPASDTWVPVPDAPFDVSGGTVAAWTGQEVVVLVRDGDSQSPTDSQRRAGAYDPVAGTWRTLAEPPDVPIGDGVSVALWTGSEVLLTGVGAGYRNRVDAYDPATDTWREAATPPGPIPDGDAVWTGSEVIVVGRTSGSSEGPGVVPGPVLAYDPSADRWREIPWSPDARPRDEPEVVWTGDRVFVGGGYALDQQGAMVGEAALLDPGTGEWTAVPDAPHPFDGNWRGRETWTGTEVLALASLDGTTATAMLFDPATATWRVDESPSGLLANPELPWVLSAGRVVFPLADGTPGGLTYTP